MASLRRSRRGLAGKMQRRPNEVWRATARHRAQTGNGVARRKDRSRVTLRENRNVKIRTPIMTRAELESPTDLGANANRDIPAALRALLADVFALYLKTKNFHWHMSGPHFRDYHLMLDEQSEQIFAMTDPIAERARKIGGTTLRSIGHIAREQRIPDNDA